jgi:uncharacterized membrane protein YuzA (DUF378 family)
MWALLINLRKMKGLHKVTFILLVIGGLNWGLEAFGTGIGHWVGESLAMVIYVLVGLSALFELFTHKKNCKDCEAKPASMPQM